jgi:hypothetical protein
MKYCFHKSGWTLRLLALAFILGLQAGPLAAAELRLVMFERTGCVWCARWDRDIGPIYPKTEEAAAAPLTRLDVGAPLPEDIRLARPAQFTPTFVLLADGEEVGRIEGYPGQDFFWSLLDALIAQAAPDNSNS